MTWINTKKRLPKIGRVVIVCYRSGYDGAPVLAFGGRVDGGEGWLWGIMDNRFGVQHNDGDNIEADDDYQVTHWMPLPASPYRKRQRTEGH